MSDNKKSWVVTAVWMALLVVDLRSAAAQESSRKPEVTMTAAYRQETDRLGVGSTLSLQVMVKNQSAGPVTVAVAAPSSTLRQPAFRSEAKTIPAGTSVWIRLGLRVEPRDVQNEVFKTQVHVVDPTTAATDNLLAQLWKDGNIGDNSRVFSVPVLVTHYDVSVTLSKIEVHEDCNPGGRSKWRGELCAAVLDAVALTWPLKVSVYEDFCDRAMVVGGGPHGDGAIVTWPVQPTRTVTWVDVGSGESIKAHRKVSLTNVPKKRHLVINFWTKVGNGSLPDQHGGVAGLERLIVPADWNNGRVVQYSPPPRSHQYPGKPPRGPGDGAEYSYHPRRHHGRHKNCGDKPYTATFTITTAPRKSTVD